MFLRIATLGFIASGFFFRSAINLILAGVLLLLVGLFFPLIAASWGLPPDRQSIFGAASSLGSLSHSSTSATSLPISSPSLASSSTSSSWTRSAPEQQSFGNDTTGPVINRLASMSDAAPPSTPVPSRWSSVASPAELTPTAAVAWCQPRCTVASFTRLQESNGVANPYGLKFEGDGLCYSFQIPAAIQYEAWDGTRLNTGLGPAALPRVCGAAFRGRV
jgi:hypothetical protein